MARSPHLRALADELARRVGALPTARILELAAGTGVATRALAAELPAAAALVATDLNQAMLDRAEPDKGGPMAPAPLDTPAAAGRPVIPADTALVIIDVQQGMDAPFLPARNNPDAERQMTALLAAWRAAGAPVIHVQHLSALPDSPLRPGQPGVELKPEVRPLPGEPLFQKHVNSAFIGTTLEGYLREHGIAHLVIVGLTTDHCVSSTARMAANLGFQVTVVSDATATFGRTGPDGRYYGPDEIHRAELAILHGEFATVRPAETLLAAANSLTLQP